MAKGQDLRRDPSPPLPPLVLATYHRHLVRHGIPARRFSSQRLPPGTFSYSLERLFSPGHAGRPDPPCAQALALSFPGRFPPADFSHSFLSRAHLVASPPSERSCRRPLACYHL